jgi:hypothetical protein
MYNTLLSYHPNGKALTPILVITLLCSFTKLQTPQQITLLHKELFG